MKKILSIMLAVLMIAGLCTFSAFASDGIVNTAPVFNDGIATLPEDGSQSGADVNVTISGGVSHRYAVDIVFENTTADFGSKFVWDVNSHKYVPSETGTGTADDATIQITPTLTITNHSDNVVYYSTSVEKNGDSTVDGLNINAYFPADGSTNVKGVVASAVVGNEQTATFTALVEVAPTEGSWSKYMNAYTNATRKVATYTVTISKDTIA